MLETFLLSADQRTQIKMRPLSLVSRTSGDRVALADSLEPIAVVGMATRFSQDAATTEDLWRLLLEVRSTWSSIPKERFNPDAFYHPDPEHGGTVSSASLEIILRRHSLMTLQIL